MKLHNYLYLLEKIEEKIIQDHDHITYNLQVIDEDHNPLEKKYS